MNCIALDKLIDMWNRDSVIDKTEPSEEIIRIPVLHSRYVSQISAHSVSLKYKQIEYIKLKKKKTDYYSGRMTQAQLDAEQWEPFRFLLKQDINLYLEADDDLVELKRKMINNEEAISFCERVGKELSNRTWQIRDYMSWEKFKNGQF